MEWVGIAGAVISGLGTLYKAYKKWGSQKNEGVFIGSCDESP